MTINPKVEFNKLFNEILPDLTKRSFKFHLDNYFKMFDIKPNDLTSTKEEKERFKNYLIFKYKLKEQI